MGNCCLDSANLKSLVDQAEIPEALLETQKQTIAQHKDSIFSIKSKSAPKKSTLFITSETNEGSKLENSLTSHFEFSKALTPRCSCGSGLVWQVDILNIKYSLTGNHNLICAEDQKVFSSAAWFCQSCSSTVCRSCLEFNSQVPGLSCDLSHQIEFFPDTLAYRYSKFNSKYFYCKFCLQPKMEPAGSCRECDFNICTACLIKNGVGLKPVLTCYGQHPLVYRLFEKDQSETQCCICYKGGAKDRVCCDECEFNLCFYCALQVSSKVFIHPGIQCRKRHFFSVESMKRFKKNKRNWVVCIKCSLANMTFVYGCKDCEVCLCLNCAWDVKKNIETFSSRTCGNGHFFVWNPVGKKYAEKCGFCEIGLEYSGYYCEECDLALCTDCIQYSSSGLGSGSFHNSQVLN